MAEPRPDPRAQVQSTWVSAVCPGQAQPLGRAQKVFVGEVNEHTQTAFPPPGLACGVGLAVGPTSPLQGAGLGHGAECLEGVTAPLLDSPLKQ